MKTKGVLIQLRMTSRLGDVNPYDAYDELQAVLRDHPFLEIVQAEIRVEKDEEKTSI